PGTRWTSGEADRGSIERRQPIRSDDHGPDRAGKHQQRRRGMTTRRWLALPAAAAILFAACSGGASTAPSTAASAEPATPAPASSAPAESTPPEAIKLGFVTHVLGNPFIQQIIDGANAAAKDLNVDLQVTGPEGGD